MSSFGSRSQLTDAELTQIGPQKAALHLEQAFTSCCGRRGKGTVVPKPNSYALIHTLAASQFRTEQSQSSTTLASLLPEGLSKSHSGDIVTVEQEMLSASR